MHDKDSLRLLALSQHDIVTRPQALACGMSDRQIEERLQHPLWLALERGIYLVRPIAPSLLQRAQASVLHGGRDAVLTGAAALEVRGVRIHWEPPCAVLIPRGRRAVSTAMTQVIRTSLMPQWDSLFGLPVAPAARAAIDHACRAVSLDEARAVIAATVQQGFADPASLAAESRGLPRLRAYARQALEEVTRGARSVPEAELMRKFSKAGVTGLLFNPKVYDADGFLCCPDALEPETMTALEVDSMEYHLSPAAYAQTQARRTRIMASGVLLVTASPSQVRGEFDVLLKNFLATVAHAKSRPTPTHLRIVP